MNRYFDHEQLDIYQLELSFVAWATDLIEEVRKSSGFKAREVCDHLDRASLSCLFNTAEGNGKRQMKTRGRFFDDARGSTTECAACLDALVAKKVCGAERVVAGKEMLLRMFSMLTKLVFRFSPDHGVREDTCQYTVEHEEEHEDEHEHEEECKL